MEITVKPANLRYEHQREAQRIFVYNDGYGGAAEIIVKAGGVTRN